MHWASSDFSIFLLASAFPLPASCCVYSGIRIPVDSKLSNRERRAQITEYKDELYFRLRIRRYIPALAPPILAADISRVYRHGCFFADGLPFSRGSRHDFTSYLSARCKWIFGFARLDASLRLQQEFPLSYELDFLMKSLEGYPIKYWNESPQLQP